MPDDGEDRVTHGHDRAVLAAASGQAPVALAEEGIGACQCGDDLAQGGGQPGVAPAGGAAFLGAGGLVVDGGELGPGDQVRGGGETAHLDPISAISSWAATTPTPRASAKCGLVS
jgi:hypothetical protein